MNKKQQLIYKYEPSWMDSGNVPDKYLSDPDYRVSQRKNSDKTLPVMICAHGYSASTYEWEEFREYAEANSRILVSNILLGGHGRSVYEFEASTWEDWGKPILEEYRALAEQGYTNLNLIGSSTGATLMLYYLLNGTFGSQPAPGHLFLIDPFILSMDKLFPLVPLLGKFIRNLPFTRFSAEERMHYYVNRPSSTLIELYQLTRKTRNLFKSNPVLPHQTHITVYKARTDNTADPQSAVLIGKSLSGSEGEKPEIIMVNTNKHVFTRRKGRKNWSEKDTVLQHKTFDEIMGKI